MARELTYEERIKWFISNYYETGMEYEGLLHSMKNTNLDGFPWYDEIVSIPRYSDEVLFPESLRKANEVLERTKDSLPTVDNNLYSEIEHLIITWSIDGTKTAGHLTRQIMKLVEGSELRQETIDEEAEKWVFETNSHRWSNNDDTAGDNYGSFKAGVKWMETQMEKLKDFDTWKEWKNKS